MTRLVRILDAIHARLGRLIAVLEACAAVGSEPCRWCGADRARIDGLCFDCAREPHARAS